MRKHRLEQSLKQAEVAEIIGVSEDSITYWENKRSQPQIRYYPKIIEFLGYNPFPINESTLGGKIKKYRFENGLSIKHLSKTLNVEERTLSSWEQNEALPEIDKFKKLKELMSK